MRGAARAVIIQRDMRARGLLAGALIALVASSAAIGAAIRSVVVRDRADVAGKLDIRRVSLARAADGRLRVAITMDEDWAGSDLLARSGPPGSICLRVWTTPDAGRRVADFLVCVTARRDGRLQGSVLREREDGLPVRVAAANVARSSARSVVLRFSQSSVGRPARVYFAAEATRAGCQRVSCVDTAPDAPRTRRLTLRSSGG